MIPWLLIDDILDTKTTITLTDLNPSDGNIQPIELLIISLLISTLKPKKIFEIGTFNGRTTINMALNQPKDGEVVTLDLPTNETKLPLAETEEKYILGKDGRRQTHAQIKQIYGDSADYDFTDYIDRVDFMFVDGSHSYEYTTNDSKVAYNLVRRGGYILFHDYGNPSWPGVTEALNELYLGNSDFRQLRRIVGTTLCILQNR
jgi:predicted O-methyltransferase YrrM